MMLRLWTVKEMLSGASQKDFKLIIVKFNRVVVVI